MNNSEKWEYIDLKVEGTTRMDELLLLAHYAAQVPENGIIVDIGTCEGRSAFALTMGSKDSVKVITIDPTPSPRVDEHQKELGMDDRLHLIKETSVGAWENWKDEVDMYFHDGLHDHSGVTTDNEMFCKYVKKDGLCLYHDYKLYNNSVGQAIEDGEGVYYSKIKVVDNIYIGRKI